MIILQNGKRVIYEHFATAHPLKIDMGRSA